MTHPDEETELRAQRPARAFVLCCTLIAFLLVLGALIAL
jgi:hypothetical protein